MSNAQPAQPATNDRMKQVGVALLLIALIAWYAMANRPATPVRHEAVAPDAPTDADASFVAEGEVLYADGEYSVIGEYVAPSGPERVGVTITLRDDVIVASTARVVSVHPISSVMQDVFANNHREQVVGRHIDEVELFKVATSSLTPRGFNDALEKIKDEARIAS